MGLRRRLPARSPCPPLRASRAPHPPSRAAPSHQHRRPARATRMRPITADAALAVARVLGVAVRTQAPAGWRARLQRSPAAWEEAAAAAAAGGGVPRWHRRRLLQQRRGGGGGAGGVGGPAAGRGYAHRRYGCGGRGGGRGRRRGRPGPGGGDGHGQKLDAEVQLAQVRGGRACACACACRVCGVAIVTCAVADPRAPPPFSSVCVWVVYI